MVVCSVPGCAAKGTKMFHSFPKDPAIRAKWIKNTKTTYLTSKDLDSYGKVCKYHFRETDFELNARGQVGLKKGTIPSLNLPEDEHNYTQVSYWKLMDKFLLIFIMILAVG